MYALTDYQKKAVQELYDRFKRMLKSTEQEVCIFKAPTGSGKTIVVADLLRKLAKEKNENKISIIWIAPKMLHSQSKDKLENIYHDQILKCSNFEDLQDNQIDQNEILFFNWESINKINNIYILDNEQDKTLLNVVQNTKNENHKLILIIDESHYAASGEKSLEIIHDLAPDITLEVSATPHIKNADENYKIRLEDVINEEMIKNEILINPKFLNIKIGSKDTDDIIIEQALKQREFLKKSFEKEGSNINPLLLIQLPNKKSLMDDKRDDVISILKNKHNITEKNEKLAIWLSNAKTDTLSNIEKNENKVQVLIFKQAISIGWDCPRASILVVFREYTSFEFTIQTIGRIMRMPDPDHGYYNMSELNRGYIFTNIENIDLTEEYVKNYISLHESYRNESAYKPIKIKSVYLKRHRELTRLSGEFVKIFNNPIITEPLKQKIKHKPTKIVKLIPSDGYIQNINIVGEIEIRGKREFNMSNKEIQRIFDKFVNFACFPYASYDSSDRVKTALYQFLENAFGLEKFDAKTQQVVLSSENYQLFLDAINEAKLMYKMKVAKKASEKRERDVTEEWNVPKVMSFKGNYSKIKKSKSIMNPFYSKEMSNPEKNFIERLSTSDKVKWWYKNGESEKKYFSIPYIDEHGKEMGFYVDFIIQFNDGSIGLFDTKSGRTAADAGTRHDGLYKYMQDEQKKGKNLIGGIIVESNSTWRYNDEKKFHFDENDLSNWKILDF